MDLNTRSTDENVNAFPLYRQVLAVELFIKKMYFLHTLGTNSEAFMLNCPASLSISISWYMWTVIILKITQEILQKFYFILVL